MLADFLQFVLTVFRMIISLFQNTDLGGFSYESVLVSIAVLSMIIGLIFSKK
ncbi:MAG: hypothetical protein IKK95_06125 [Lachnospiraceae bacterium]|nr:hypothetical protein [Lachnospiraceae bacterium]